MPRPIFALALAVTLASAAPAAASESAKPKEVGQYVDLRPVALPIVAKGRLVNYVFVSVRINLSGSANVAKLRAKEPFFRDALVRAGHRTPFTVPTDHQKIDEQRLTARLRRDAADIAGADAIRSVVVSSQTPQRRVATPRPAA